ncbi:MAG: ABC transporter permease, partial [Eubacterium sp.]|nr:ABC transporter permease [Eubacterium sp.]
MKTGLYPQLALNGIKKNKRLYLPYILTCAGMVMMFYIVSFLARGETITKLRGGTMMQFCLQLGLGVIGVFSLIFLFYTNSFLIRRRKKEFGLYNILGMGKVNLARVLIWESLIVSAVSLLGGMFCGILFSKLAELLMLNILQMETDFSLSISLDSIVYTVVLFAIIFFLILLNTLKQITVSKPIELLHSENAGEKPPKANWVVALAGVVIMAIAYYIAISIEEPLEAIMWFFIAVVLVIIATYLLFIAGSVALCKLLQKKKNYYYKTNHFISVSSMLFRMKRNGAGLASICILCTMVLVMVSSTVCLYMGAEDSLGKRYPRNILSDVTVSEIADLNADNVKVISDTALKIVEEKGEQAENVLNYNYAVFNGDYENGKVTTSEIEKVSDQTIVFIVSLDDYNKITGKSETLSENEVFVNTSKGLKLQKNSIVIEGGKTFTIKGEIDKFVDSSLETMYVFQSIFLVVNDFESTVSPMMNIADFKGDPLVSLHNFFGFDLSCDDEKQNDIFNAFSDEMSTQKSKIEGMEHAKRECSAIERTEFYELYGSLFFLGILLGIVFVFAAVLIIYYKQISEGYEDQSRFDIMQKVGMNKKEIKKSINSQVLTVFFMPLLVSAIHLGFAFPMIYKMLMLFAITDLAFLIYVTLGCFAVFTMFYIIDVSYTNLRAHE